MDCDLIPPSAEVTGSPPAARTNPMMQSPPGNKAGERPTQMARQRVECVPLAAAVWSTMPPKKRQQAGRTPTLREILRRRRTTGVSGGSQPSQAQELPVTKKAAPHPFHALVRRSHELRS